MLCIVVVFSRARKEEKANAEKEKKQKAIDDALWQDDNKKLQKKQVSILGFYFTYSYKRYNQCNIT